MEELLVDDHMGCFTVVESPLHPTVAIMDDDDNGVGKQ
jgi:hypothetical protein